MRVSEIWIIMHVGISGIDYRLYHVCMILYPG